MQNMNPKAKANQIKDYFAFEMNYTTMKEEVQKKMQIRMSKAYVYRLLNDIPMLSGDYKMAYTHEWHQYESYWHEVIYAI